MKTISIQKQTEKVLSFTPGANSLSTMPDSILHPAKEQKEFASKMPNRVTKVLSLILMGSGLLFGGASQSYAIDSKVYPGSMCVRWDAGYDPDPVLFFSELNNPSSNRELRLDCPVVRDRKDNIKKAWVTVTDVHGKKNICPLLAGVQHLGNSFWAYWIPSSPKCTTGVNTNVKQLHFGEFKVPNDAHIYISIRIPEADQGRKSGIVTYRVSEYTGNIFQTKD